MLLQAGALGMVAVGQDFGIWLAAAVLLGLGTAMVYPTLLAAIGDVAATRRPDAAVSPATTTPTAAGMPYASATIPESSAPTANPPSRHSR